jgi:tetratricopeptide (TPR) repeat protein
MSLFKKTIGTQCLGQVEPACPNFVNKTLLPSHKRYDDCGSAVREVTATNYVTVFATLAAVIVAVGTIGTYLYVRARGMAIDAAADVTSSAARSLKSQAAAVSKPHDSPSDSRAKQLDAKVSNALLTVAFKNGIGYAGQRMYDNALKEFLTVESSQPDFPGIQLNIGATYLQLRQFEAARQHLTKAQQQAPSDPNLYYNLACLEAATGNGVAAIQNLRTAVDHGFRDLNALKSDPDLTSIRRDKQFAEIVKGASQK